MTGRNIIFISIAILSVLVSSCGQKKNPIETVANNFLEPFFSADYKKAAHFCSPELAPKLTVSADDFDKLDDGVKKAILEINKNVSYKIQSVKDIDKNTYRVHYELTTPESATPVLRDLTVIKIDKVWKVSAMDGI